LVNFDIFLRAGRVDFVDFDYYIREMEKIVCQNPKAHRDFFLEEKYEAGLELKGSEVKSLREGKASVKESFALIEDGEVFLVNSYIAPYEGANQFNHDPKRSRKLLLHRREINRLIGRTQIKGYTLIPVKIYFKNGRAKVELALAKGKKAYDRREDIKRREAQREMDKAFKKARN
jgi:SsrA-binding protein